MEKANLEKNRKRTFKTCAQVDALEKFYNEHNYPTEEMKIQLAESISLTEKQVFGWFCHRSLKDKRLTTGEKCITKRQDNKPNGVIHDLGGGHRQDSCGSTKQGDQRNLDTWEIESAKVAPKELFAADLINAMPDSHRTQKYNHVGDLSLGSTSLRNMPNHQNGVPMDIATANYTVDVKSLKLRRGPSGYLKVKGQVENGAVAAVKRQLGKHYREDGPQLCVDFDPLPPQAFKSVLKDLAEAYHSGEDASPVSADVTKIHWDPIFGQGYEHNSTNSNETSFQMRRVQSIPDGYIDKKFRRTALSTGGVCYPGSNSSLQFPETPDKCIPGGHSRDEYGSKPESGPEVVRLNAMSTHPQLQNYSGKARADQFSKYDDADRKVFRENTHNENSTLAMKRKAYPRQNSKNGNLYADWNRVKIPFNRDLNSTERVRREVLPLQRLKTSSVVDHLQQSNHFARSPDRDAIEL